MTLEEKAAQMMCVWQQKGETLLDDQGRFDPSKAKAAFKKPMAWVRLDAPATPAPRPATRAMARRRGAWRN